MEWFFWRVHFIHQMVIVFFFFFWRIFPVKFHPLVCARKRGFLWWSSFWKERTICALWSTLFYCSKFNGKLYFGIWKWVPNIIFHQLLIHQDSPAFLPSLILLYLLVTMQGKGRSKGHVWLLLSLNLGLLILFYFDSLSRFFFFNWCLT
jgi:hypothetical protein